MGIILNNPKLKERRRDLRRNHTEAEKILWKHLRNKQFYGVKFFRQYSVGVYIVDFYSPLLKLAIEIDGGQHAEEENKKYDEMRSAYLKGQDIEVMRFWNNEVMQNIEGVLYKIAERLTPPSLPFSKGEEQSTPSLLKRGLGGVGGRGS